MAALTSIKMMLGWDPSDGDGDDLLRQIVRLIEAQLKNRLGGVDEIPDELEYVITNCALARFNQIGSEGTTSHWVGEEKQEWIADIFAPYEKDIQAYLDKKNDTSDGMHIRFF